MQHVITSIQNTTAVAASRQRDALSTGQQRQRRAGPGVRRSQRGVSHPDSVGAHSQPVSTATRAARRAPVVTLGALVLCLSALVLSQTGCDKVLGLQEIVKPNYFACDFDCSRRVTAELGADVFSLPGGSFLYAVPIGSVGTILDGPVDRDVNGTTMVWWQVQFDGRPPLPPGQGWVRQELLTVANETLVTKEAKACLPAQFNPYLGDWDSPAPTFDDLQAFCGGDVAVEAQAVLYEELAPLGRFLCQGSPQAVLDKNYDASCTVPCTDGSDVCLVAGSDPPDPTPEPLSAALFQPTSVCEVTGLVEISVDGHEPKTQPTAQGVLEIRGRPCPPGEGCRVGMSYRLTGDDIEFDSGSVFASDPKFVDLSLSGATEPDAINLGELLPDLYLGEVPAGTAFSSAQVKRPLVFGLLGITYGVHGRNAEGLALAMNWTTKACRVGGQLVGTAVGDDDEGTLDAQVDVALDGVIVNQPPWPDAGPDQTVECTSPAGAAVTLDASGSTDADDNISFSVWRRGSATGSLLTAPSSNPVAQTSQALGEETYYLQVVDIRFAADDDAVRVSVVDTTAPTISCNAPATITPSDVQDGISFTATATDVCSGVSRVAVTGFACARPESCKVTFAGDTITILDSGGVGNKISWTVSAQDGTGNAGQKTCQIEVIKKK